MWITGSIPKPNFFEKWKHDKQQVRDIVFLETKQKSRTRCTSFLLLVNQTDTPRKRKKTLCIAKEERSQRRFEKEKPKYQTEINNLLSFTSVSCKPKISQEKEKPKQKPRKRTKTRSTLDLDHFLGNQTEPKRKD